MYYYIKYMNDLMFKIKMSCIFVTEMFLLYGLHRHIKKYKHYGGMCYPDNYTIYEHYQ